MYYITVIIIIVCHILDMYGKLHVCVCLEEGRKYIVYRERGGSCGTVGMQGREARGWRVSHPMETTLH